ncbi:cytochrome d ubiquinol oxidase subunit II [Pokkaliibacter sp. MBI-7]|uniref:Cytochrome d ubiquinol oxidase subunit II n=1 Tax=Proteobacteria bacterium 228 TaxID=2083153 RepID=A0A2S5KHE6_9PROT|nr:MULTISPECIES: cytochrome d ubiquinol oxidase subunit II [Pokkaliibacter]MDH2435893.1 cytochrome d ubiquinol oxidase subunit II [Pokkaliibacter sp. MBI-7]PPC74234.1 cytochrome d ubiquinol oxidase subunit II [Pokkaliibacter plantistimulans]
MPSYEELQLIWWVLVAVLLIGFALTDGFDMGAAILLPWVGRTDGERRVVINTLGPHWDGNQVWLITAGGALFAAWPPVYAAAFSGFYWAMLLVLFALFLRPVGFDYRSKLDNPQWRNAWDWGLFVGSLVPALVFGVAFGNLLQGVPFDLDEFLRVSYHGSFWALLNPFALLCGVISLSMLTLHGASWLVMRTEGDILARCRKVQGILSVVVIVCFTLAGLWLTMGIMGMSITSSPQAGNPLIKTVAMNNLGWQDFYKANPMAWLAPIVAYAGLVLSFFASRGGRWTGFLGSSLAIIGVLLTVGLALFPFIMPSSLAPSHSLTVWDATSSEKTLGIMLIAALIFVPIILCYTLWCYWKMWGTVTVKDIQAYSHSRY